MTFRGQPSTVLHLRSSVPPAQLVAILRRDVQALDLMRLFVTRGMKLALSGIGLGLAAASLLTPLMKSVLFGVSPLDPLTLTMVPVALMLVALMACYLPARRAARADPKVALRYE